MSRLTEWALWSVAAFVLLLAWQCVRRPRRPPVGALRDHINMTERVKEGFTAFMSSTEGIGTALMDVKMLPFSRKEIIDAFTSLLMAADTDAEEKAATFVLMALPLFQPGVGAIPVWPQGVDIRTTDPQQILTTAKKLGPIWRRHWPRVMSETQAMQQHVETSIAKARAIRARFN